MPSGWSALTKVSLRSPVLCPVEAEGAVLTIAVRVQLRPGALFLQLGPDGGPEALQVLDPLLGPPGRPGPAGPAPRAGRRWPAPTRPPPPSEG